jgi:hypothetical protein
MPADASERARRSGELNIFVVPVGEVGNRFRLEELPASSTRFTWRDRRAETHGQPLVYVKRRASHFLTARPVYQPRQGAEVVVRRGPSLRGCVTDVAPTRRVHVGGMDTSRDTGDPIRPGDKMPGRRENDRWVPPKQARQLETLTVEIIHGRWQFNVGSQKANTQRPAADPLGRSVMAWPLDHGVLGVV